MPGSRKRVRARCIPGPLLRIARVSGQTVKTCYGKRSSQKESYEMNLKLKSVLLVAGLCLSAQAAVVYQDDFTGVAGSLLNGRSPNLVNTEGKTYTATDTLQLDGNGLAVSTSGAGSASIAMPALTANDTVVMTAVFRPRSSSNNWMGFGLARDPAALTGDGAVWVLVRGGPHSNGGIVSISSGPGTAGNVYATLAGTQPEAGFEGINPSTLKITYIVKTGHMKVELGVNTVFEGLIAYNGTAGTPAPLDAIDYFTFQWNAQLTSTSPTPGYFDSITVEVIRNKLKLVVIH